MNSSGHASTRPVNSEIPVTGLASGQGRHPHALAMPSMRPICRVLNSGLNRNRPHVPRRATPLWGNPVPGVILRLVRFGGRTVQFTLIRLRRPGVGLIQDDRERRQRRPTPAPVIRVLHTDATGRVVRDSADGELQRQGEHDSNVEPMSLTDLLPESATADIVDAIRAAADTGLLSSSRSTSSPKTR